MADTAKIMDVLHNAKQIVTDAVEKVTKEMVLKVRIFILLFDYRWGYQLQWDWETWLDKFELLELLQMKEQL